MIITAILSVKKKKLALENMFVDLNVNACRHRHGLEAWVCR